MYEEEDWSAPEDAVSLAPHEDDGEGDVEMTLRPRKLSEFVGQARVREQLELVLHGRHDNR